jgi:RNA polymerase sigma factor (sigma-70 family)
MSFEEVYEKYYKLTNSMAYKFTNSFNTLDELKSIGNYSIYKTFLNYDSKRNNSFLSLLVEITKNDLIGSLRQDKKKNKETSIDLYFNIESTLEYYDYDKYENLKILINDLKPKYKDLVILYYFGGYNQGEIADKFKVNRSTISRNLKKAIKLMGVNK